MNRIKILALTVTAAAGFALAANAAISYPTPGVENPEHYSFTATADGDITAYFALETVTAAYTENIGLLVNGVSTGVTGLENQTSHLGDSVVLGHVHAGDVLTFVLNITAPPYAVGTVYSDPALNAGYDGGGAHQHVYSTAYDSSTGQFGSAPSGTYVAFEDLPAGSADWNYHDDAFVFTDVTAVPEPTTMVAGALLLLPFGLSAIRRVRKNTTS